jgi:hypothetical protein
VFRQVVAIRWAAGISVEDQQGFRDALDGLREIPELLALTWGDDAGHFDGNFDLVGAGVERRQRAGWRWYSRNTFGPVPEAGG